MSLVRSYRLGRELTDLRARFAILEHQLQAAIATGQTHAAPTVAPAPHGPASPEVPSSLPPEAAVVAPMVASASSSFPPPVTEAAASAPGVTAAETFAASSAPATAASTASGAAPPASVPGPGSTTALPSSAHEIEAAIGGRLMLWVGTIVLVLGLAFFLKYAFDNQWINEPMRVGLGVAAGLAIAIVGHRFVGRGYRAYGQILTGGGLAVLYLSIYAGYAYYALFGPTTAFTLLVWVTVAAAWMADRQDAVGLALMGVGGGYLTPFLVGGGTDQQIALFSYDALLAAGTLFLARRRDWPVLNVVSFVATWITVAAWADRFYSPAKWQRTEFFLTVYCALFLMILRAQVARHGWRNLVSLLLVTGPLLYHLSSLAILNGHGVAPLVYLIAVTVTGVGLAVRAHSVVWRVIVWWAVLPPLLAWIGGHGSGKWLVANLVAALGVFALHLVAQLDVRLRHERSLSRLDGVLMHLNGYGVIAGLYLALEQVALVWAPGAAVLVAAGHGGIAWQLRRADRGGALHALAVALGAVTIACALQFDGPWLTVALVTEGALVVTLGLALGEAWFRVAGAALLVTAIGRYAGLSLPATPPVFRWFQDEPFVMALVVATALYFVAWRYRQSEAVRERRLGLALAVLLASMFVVIALSVENSLYWDLRGEVSSDAHFAESLTLSVIWTACAGAFMAAGWWRRYAPVRFLAMALFGLTVLKVFLVDFSALGGIYRILGFMGVGLALLAVSFLYQRSRRKPLAPGDEPAVGQGITPNS